MRLEWKNHGKLATTKHAETRLKERSNYCRKKQIEENGVFYDVTNPGDVNRLDEDTLVYSPELEVIGARDKGTLITVVPKSRGTMEKVGDGFKKKNMKHNTVNLRDEVQQDMEARIHE